MRQMASQGSECSARVLALLIAADAHVDKRELERLEELDAFGRMGISRSRFLELVEACRNELGDSLCGQSWLRLDDLERIDRILGTVDDADERLLVCRLAASVLTADGCVTEAERLVYDHVLGYWHINRSMVSEAILHDAVH